MAKRHDRRYHGEAYLFALCCFCEGSTLERLFSRSILSSINRVLLHGGRGEFRLTTDMRLAHAR